jgi:hypothetical protein
MIPRNFEHTNGLLVFVISSFFLLEPSFIVLLWVTYNPAMIFREVKGKAGCQKRQARKQASFSFKQGFFYSPSTL